MAVSPLNLPPIINVPQLDWSKLDKIGNAITDYRRRGLFAQQVQDATGPDGKVDYDKLVSNLGREGFDDEARQYAALAQAGQFHKDSLTQQQAQLAESARHNKAAEAQSAAALAESRREHDLQSSKPIPFETITGTKWLTRDPTAPDGYRVVDAARLQQGAAVPQGGGAAGAPASFAERFPQSNGVPSATDLMAIDPKTGRREAWLKAQSPEAQQYIKDVADYKIDPRTSSIKGGKREQTLAAVATYDPTYDQNTFGARAKAVKDFGTGPLGNSVRSFDVAIDHLDTLQRYADAMKNGDLRLMNTIRNIWREQTGSDLPTNVQAIAPIVGGEVAKAIVGSNNALADREELRKPLSTAASPEQLSGAINGYKSLMAGQLKGLKKQYEDTTGRKDFDSRVRESTRSALLGHDGKSQAGADGEIPSPPPGFKLVR